MDNIIFSDIDATLVHKSDEGDLIRIPEENKYISREAVELINKLMEEDKFAIITGRRKSGFERLGSIIPHNYAVIEHGCIILDRASFDDDWAYHLKDVIGDIGGYEGLLWQYERQLQSEGYKTDSEGRYASFRVCLDKPHKMTEEEKQNIEKKVEKEAGSFGITTTRNQNMLDILPVKGGKANAINYIIDKEGALGNQMSKVLALGDDTNDKEMMQYADWAACPGNANDDVKKIVLANSGYVSKKMYHQGTLDILKKTLSLR